jgi:hypothetical protein
MKTRTIASFIVCSFLASVLQLVALLTGSVVGLLCGVLVAVVVDLLIAFFQIEVAEWIAIVLSAGASLLGVVIVWLAGVGESKLYIWLSPLIAAACSLAIWGVKHARSKHCGLCNRRLGSSVAFACPRCALVVCDQSCWVFESRRCRLCEQNRVPIFSPDARWWDRQLGPRTDYGRCQLCQTPAQESDLRACRKCGRPQCRDCWDAANGQCSRCQWTIDDVPESLRPYVVRAV